MQREPEIRRDRASPPQAGVFIGIDVDASGKLHIVLWRDGRWDAIYAPCSVEHALSRALPQALGEAVAFAQSASAAGSKVME